ncbi:lantibiotic immunity ABC transporter MutG family permease subunit [Clostridium sp. AWRP]|uniref:lantibiotic immunity ABC transporter MutG family permease subunit n=1 Tax=Clostridium sp. AWRP TaxID=2212991 RepID=UPI000FD8D40A|nr:lantibiotic immunity ABC transporter MutG family permease subunit [Clostridium sp. AWRP]AZV58435.1 lantibiotic immunity ABC transporter MutG family permease subunit [Clostridium sp. AWRP]
MGKLFKLIRSDFQKIRHTPIIWIHIIVPILISMLFVASYYTSLPATIDTVSEVLSTGFPLIIGIVCAMVVEQEADAGNFQEILMARHKLLKFFSKLCMLLLMGLGSLIVAIGILGLGLEFLVHKNVFNAVFYGKMTLILLFCEIFLYLLHLLCSFRFGSGASIGLGIAESFITALMLTGLGDGIWKWTPCSWGGRIPGYYISLKIDNGKHLFLINEFHSGIYICLIATILLFLISFLWYNYFEGRSEN